MIDAELAYLPTLLYLLALVAALVDLRAGSGAARTTAFVCVLGGLIARIATFLPGLCPVSGAARGLGAVALFLALHFVFGFRRDPADRVRAAALAAVVLALDLATTLLTPATPVPTPSGGRALAELHGGLVLLAYAAFAVAALYSLLYLLLYHLVKARRLGFWFQRLPSLARLERRALVASGVGFGALTVGLGVGVFGLVTRTGDVPWLDPKLLLGAALWAWIGAEVLFRRVLDWTGIRVMWMPLAGAGVMVVLFAVQRTAHPFWSGG